MKTNPAQPPTAVAARLLIVEDDPETAEVLQAWLQLEGYDVRIAASGDEGLATAAHFDPHFVLLDMQLPVLQGDAVARHLRVNEQGLRRVLIGTTGFSDRTDCPVAFDHWLTKPIDLDRLRAVLKQEWATRFDGSPYAY